MSRFDDELKSALRRQEPPQGFVDRVLARAAEQRSGQIKPAWRDSWLKIFAQPLRLPLLRWAALATVSVVLALGGVHYRSVQREHAQGEAAKERLLLALRIAGNKLQLARTRVDQINSGQINSDQVNSDQPQNQQERE
jgi:hypothetical protein